MEIKTALDTAHLFHSKMIKPNEEEFFKSIEFDTSVSKKYKKKYIIGIDEVGTGSLAGPVFATACIVNLGDISNARLKYFHAKTEHLIYPTDSKRFSEYERSLLMFFMNRFVVASGTGMATVTEINELNDMVRCRQLAWERALSLLSMSWPRLNESLILSDAFAIDFKGLPNENIVKGDSLSVTIGCASILAKVSRDAYMCNLHKLFPDYDWQNNKGYTSDSQMKALESKGPTIHHRVNFRNVKAAIDTFYNSKVENSSV